MTIHSTYSKMLASMGGNSSSKITETVDDSKTKSAETMDQAPGEFTEPQLKPSPEMGNLLTNILGSSASKKYSPMD